MEMLLLIFTSNFHRWCRGCILHQVRLYRTVPCDTLFMCIYTWSLWWQDVLWLIMLPSLGPIMKHYLLRYSLSKNNISPFRFLNLFRLMSRKLCHWCWHSVEKASNPGLTWKVRILNWIHKSCLQHFSKNVGKISKFLISMVTLTKLQSLYTIMRSCSENSEHTGAHIKPKCHVNPQGLT